jgi:alanine racemase
LTKRPTRILIDLGAIEHNYFKIREKLPSETKVLAVVKADAYGHGAVEVSKTLEALKCDMLGVALCEEGIELRNAGICLPIVVLSGVYSGQLEEIVEHNLTPVLFDIQLARELHNVLLSLNKTVKVHVKIDTGMGRLGLLKEEISFFFEELKTLHTLELEGVISHFAEADEEDKEFSWEQIKRFEEAIRIIESAGTYIAMKHMANSAGIVNLPASVFNLIRPGLMLYGSYPTDDFKSKIDLAPAMSLTTAIVHLKSVPAGFPVSYGRTFITERNSLIATVPVGYGDGYLRSFSGKAEVLVKGRRAPVIGRVCMDLTMIDVTDIPEVKTGDDVVLLGRDENEEITAEELASYAGTIPYEIYCSFNRRAPRKYVFGSQALKVGNQL